MKSDPNGTNGNWDGTEPNGTERNGTRNRNRNGTKLEPKNGTENERTRKWNEKYGTKIDASAGGYNRRARARDGGDSGSQGRDPGPVGRDHLGKTIHTRPKDEMR